MDFGQCRWLDRGLKKDASIGSICDLYMKLVKKSSLHALR
jgi:hypothetical protein